LEDSTEIAAAALHVAELDRTAGIEKAEAIGSYIFEQFYGGSIETWRSRQKNKNNSLHRIAAHPECPLSKSTLYRAVCVSVTKRTHPSVSTLKHISANHLATVAALLPDAQPRGPSTSFGSTSRTCAAHRATIAVVAPTPR
jgi:hypothetical protein